MDGKCNISSELMLQTEEITNQKDLFLLVI